MQNYEQHRPAEFKYRGRWIDNWFSNMVPTEITIGTITYPSVENYYQAMKSLKREDHLYVATLTPKAAKFWGGNTVKLRSDWASVKYNVMKTGLRAKWYNEPYRSQLLATGDDIIIEWNNWNDTTWGVEIKHNMGYNLLGDALMEIRDELATQN